MEKCAQILGHLPQHNKKGNYFAAFWGILSFVILHHCQHCYITMVMLSPSVSLHTLFFQAVLIFFLASTCAHIFTSN